MGYRESCNLLGINFLCFSERNRKIRIKNTTMAGCKNGCKTKKTVKTTSMSSKMGKNPSGKMKKGGKNTTSPDEMPKY